MRISQVLAWIDRRKMARTVPYLGMLVVISTFAILDAITTYLILSDGGGELNPFMAGLYPNPLLLATIKLAYIVVIYGMAVWLGHSLRNENAGWLLVIVTALVTSIAIINNVIVLLIHYG